MKKQTIYLIIAAVLACLAIFTILYKRGVFQKQTSLTALSEIFAVKDTSQITKIFIANMYGEKVLLTKQNNRWFVDGTLCAADYKVEHLLGTLSSVRIAQTVGKAAFSNIIQALSVSGIKVEIYATSPKFEVFGKPFFVKERIIKTYYMGDATQNNLGCYALLVGMDEPFVIYKPGFRGYVTPIFTPNPVDWYSRRVFETKITRLKSASFVDFNSPNESFFVEKVGARFFALYNAEKQAVAEYDTTLLINMLSEFRERNYEQYLPKIPQGLKDSVLQFNRFKIISVTDVNDITTTLTLYNFMDKGELWEDDQLIEKMYEEINKDRCYATINNDTSKLYTIQFHHFDRQVQPLSYFLKHNGKR